jgi:hypothetical protein
MPRGAAENAGQAIGLALVRSTHRGFLALKVTAEFARMQTYLDGLARDFRYWNSWLSLEFSVRGRTNC